MGLFFSKAALVTFGGAYAVLPYVGQQAVEKFQWLSHAQMMGGLALAESTPGPLIMVLQFVGFLGGWQHPGRLEAALAGVSAAVVGVMLSLGIKFAKASLLAEGGTLDGFVACVMVAAFIILRRAPYSLLWVLGLAGASGWISTWF